MDQGGGRLRDAFMDEVFRASSKKSFGKLLFLDYWELEREKMNVSGNPAMNAVTVMTITSQGFEFPVVLFLLPTSNCTAK